MTVANIERLALSPDEIAARNNFGIATIWREIRAGHLIAQKLGRRTFITVENEKRWLDAKPRVASQAKAGA